MSRINFGPTARKFPEVSFQFDPCDSGAAFFFLQFAVCVYKGHTSQIVGNRKSAYLKARGQILPPAMCAPGEQGKGVTVPTYV